MHSFKTIATERLESGLETGDPVKVPTQGADKVQAHQVFAIYNPEGFAKRTHWMTSVEWNLGEISLGSGRESLTERLTERK